MKKQIYLFGIFFLGLILTAQEITHETLVVNIEVPVRVFDRGKFVENLTIDDFEVYEDGKLQNVVAVYMIKKTQIEKKEEKKKFEPETSRSFYLFFEITEYSPRLQEAIDYFIQNVLIPGDSLVVVSPMKTYRMKSETLEVLPKEEVVDQLRGILRKDALMGNSEYRDVVNELTGLARALSSVFGGEPGKIDSNIASGLIEMDADMKLEYLLDQYAVTLKNLENIRSIDQQKLLEFAEFLKEKQGQKYVFLFYQREFIPQIEPKLLSQALGTYQDQPQVLSSVMNLFQFYRRDISIDVDKIKRAYADASVAIHFLFFSKPAEYVPGVYFEEHSEDIFAPFIEIAKATGGSAESSSNPKFLFEKAVESSENYYLLYYSPLSYKKDGKFKSIKVKVRNKNYTVTHRAGYFAN